MTTENQPSAPTPKILAINSFPANGNAGLKMAMSVLGTHAIPVPTLLLSGIGNMPGFQRFPVPFYELLDGTLTLARQNGHSLVVYVGYLGSADQPALITDALARFWDIIKYIVVDPVCGDNGRAYTTDAIIDAWHDLLPLADLVLPNFTETALLTGIRENIVPENAERYLSAFRNRYPAQDCIVTGIRFENQVINRWVRAATGVITDFAHPYYPQYFSGTGDLFASVLLRYLCLENQSMPQAIVNAGRVLETIIRQSVMAGRTELLLTPELPYLLTPATDA